MNFYHDYGSFPHNSSRKTTEYILNVHLHTMNYDGTLNAQTKSFSNLIFVLDIQCKRVVFKRMWKVEYISWFVFLILILNVSFLKVRYILTGFLIGIDFGICCVPFSVHNFYLSYSNERNHGCCDGYFLDQKIEKCISKWTRLMKTNNTCICLHVCVLMF